MGRNVVYLYEQTSAREEVLLHSPGFSIRARPGKAADIGQLKDFATSALLHAHFDGMSRPLPRDQLPMLASAFTQKERACRVDCQRALLGGCN